jgi:hypothetical protein
MAEDNVDILLNCIKYLKESRYVETSPKKR